MYWKMKKITKLNYFFLKKKQCLIMRWKKKVPKKIEDNPCPGHLIGNIKYKKTMKINS
jgi:hypothetical protein